MNLKQAVANSLLMFVAATCVVLIVKAVSPTSAARPVTLDDGPLEGVAANTPQDAAMVDGVHVYYLHGNFRCTTCRTIEELAEESVRSGFADQLQSGQVHWHVINYDEPENRQFALDFEVAAPTVVLARLVDGKRVDWEALPEVWSFVGNKRLFLTYVQGSLREFLGSSSEPASQAADSQAADSQAADSQAADSQATPLWNAQLPFPTNRE
jgi:hypothetical protein